MVKVVILCGGIGSRLWPLSRKEKPKQFLKLPNARYNLFQETVLRVNKLEVQCSEIIIISNIEIKNDIVQSIASLFLNYKITYIWEPIMKNTGPAIGTLLGYLNMDDDCIVWPSDHVITMNDFNNSLRIANYYVANNIITFGICPTYPETGYGYITAGENYKIDKFIEKPPEKIAEQLIKNSKCYWNGGIFYFRIKTLMDEYKKNYPELFDTIIQAIGQKIENDIYIDKNIYEKYEDIAFDKLVMEKTDNGIIIPFHGSWSDIGSWDSLAKIYLTDDLAPEQGSEAISPHIADDNHNIIQLDNKNCTIFNYNDKQIISTIGLKNICIVNMRDALLISDLSQTQKVKTIYQKLDIDKSIYVQKHTKNDYIWGSSEEIDSSNSHNIIKYTINVNASSSEIHAFLNSFLVILMGTGKVKLDDGMVLPFDKNEKINLPNNHKYQIHNNSLDKKIVCLVCNIN